MSSPPLQSWNSRPIAKKLQKCDKSTPNTNWATTGSNSQSNKSLTAALNAAKRKPPSTSTNTSSIMAFQPNLSIPINHQPGIQNLDSAIPKIHPKIKNSIEYGPGKDPVDAPSSEKGQKKDQSLFGSMLELGVIIKEEYLKIVEPYVTTMLYQSAEASVTGNYVTVGDLYGDNTATFV